MASATSEVWFHSDTSTPDHLLRQNPCIYLHLFLKFRMVEGKE